MAMKEFDCKISHRVILSAISLLKEKGLCTTIRGLYEILIGTNVDQRVKSLDCYNHYSSLSKRGFNTRVRMLIRYGFISNVYRKEIGGYVLNINEKGLKEANYTHWHKYPVGQSDILEIKNEERIS